MRDPFIKVNVNKLRPTKNKNRSKKLRAMTQNQFNFRPARDVIF
jgi:hypothetical protein